ncbi:MAG: dTMP kinase [Alphaproteobacteria bacterium]
MSRGRFITIEGGEGAGKSTQVALLADALGRRGLDVTTTREPGGTPIAEALRGLLLRPREPEFLPLTEALLHWAARTDHWHRLIRPALDRDQWVVCDRFADSTLAYQGHGLGAGLDQLVALHRIALGAVKPDVTVILDLPVSEGLARARTRARADRYEAMDAGFHERLRQGFLAIARAEPERCAVVDATAPPASVHERILAEVLRRTAMDRP